MAVTLTSPVLGLDVGAVHSGPEEDWLLAQGYARRDGYVGPGVSETGASDVTPDNDLTLASNREPAPRKFAEGGQDSDPVGYDFDAGGVQDDPPSLGEVTPADQPLGGGAATLYGQNFEGVTGVTVGGTAATGVTVVSDQEVSATFPAKAAGTYDVVVTNPFGSDTAVGAVTYA